MRDLHRSRLPVALLCVACLDASAPVRSIGATSSRAPVENAMSEDGSTGAQVTAAPQDSTASLERVRELIKDGEYDSAIEILKRAIAGAQERPATLREAYLLLIKTYVFIGNDLKFKPQGREASNLNYQEARKLIAECLGIDALRHTQPEPAAEYPPEMHAMFAEVRSRIFGAFRVASLEPREAVVLLDDDTLRALPRDSLLGDVDLRVGNHLVLVRAKGYKEVKEEIVISPSAVLERSYQLRRKRGPAWYATASLVTVASVIGVFAVGRGSTTPPDEPGPLPPAPPPPTR